MNKTWQKIRIYMGFPQTKLFLIILGITIIVFIVSMNIKDDYWQPLLSNIFAGLSTGLVVYSLGGLRQIFFAVHERKIKWLQDLRQQIKEYSQMHSHFLKDDYDETESKDFVGEMCGILVCIGESALQSTFDRRMLFNSEKYCRKDLKFDPDALYKKSCKILESFCDNAYPEKEDVVNLLNDIDGEVQSLNKKIDSEIKNLEVIIATAHRFVL